MFRFHINPKQSLGIQSGRCNWTRQPSGMHEMISMAECKRESDNLLDDKGATYAEITRFDVIWRRILEMRSFLVRLIYFIQIL